jgi:hypothetical protein
MLLVKWYHEIKHVGLSDWIWFVIWLKRDEFNQKLNFARFYPNMNKLVKTRDRAHRIDDMLEEIQLARR